MGYKLEVNHPDFPKDTEFDLGGIAVKNGSTVTLTAADEDRIVARHGQTVKEALGNSPFVKLTGSKDKEGGDA